MVLIASAIYLFSFFACTDNFMQEATDHFGSGHDNGCHPKVLQNKPIISVDELQKVMKFDNVVVVDVRTVEEYDAGHIPGSINIPFVVPFSPWIISGDLLMELPPVEDLEAMLGAAGISNQSQVALVTGIGQPPFPNAAGPRVALTLHYLGLDAVSILDGGIDKWVAKGKPLTSVPTVLPETTFIARPAQNLFVDINYVDASIGKKLILDGRDAEVYSGEVIEPWALQPGHIPTAVSFPAISVWNADGTYKTKSQLDKIAKSVIGPGSKNREIVVYCGVGGYGSVLYYVLHDLLEYKNIKFYDGSAQEWSLLREMEL